MYRIMMADDEGIEREAFRLLVKRYFNNLEQVEDAATGNEAVRNAELYKPDIIILDIEMPEKNGLEALTEIKKILPGVRVIILSAFDNFEYAQRAMKLGAVEYLLKPVSHQDMIETLNIHIDALNKEKSRAEKTETLKRQIDALTPHIEKDVLRYMINDTRDTNQITECLNLLDIPTAEGLMLFIQTSEHKDNAQQTIKRVISDMSNCMICKHLDNGYSVFIPMEVSMDPASLHTWSEDFARYIYQSLKSFGIEVKIGISKPMSVTKNYHKCFKQAYVASKYMLGMVNIYEYEVKQTANADNNYPVEYENRLLRLMHNGTSAEMHIAYNEYIKALTETYSGNQMYMRQKLKELLIVSNKSVAGLGGEFESSVLYTEIDHMDELASVIKIVEEQLSEIYKRLHGYEERKLSMTIMCALKYINENYANNIALSDVADEANVSMYYLSKQFKLEMNKNFVEYLNDLRINKAKALLKTTNMSIKEIAYTVGYNNQTYFCKIFKKQAGIAASEYRSKYMFTSHAEDEQY